MSHLRALRRANCIKISEEVQVLEAASALLGHHEIEMANRYSVCDQATGQQIFYVVESTDCCMQQLRQFFGDCTPWSADILWTGQGGADRVFRLHRPSTLTCCCLNRPTVSILDASTGDELGSITDPCTCAAMDLVASDAAGQMLFKTKKRCCQLGAMCPMPCGVCSKVEFDILDSRSASIGVLTKTVPGCCKFFLAPDVDDYVLEFGRSSTWKNPRNKAMMLGMALFMDFRYFSSNANANKGMGSSPVDKAEDTWDFLRSSEW